MFYLSALYSQFFMFLLCFYWTTISHFYNVKLLSNSDHLSTISQSINQSINDTCIALNHIQKTSQSVLHNSPRGANQPQNQKTLFFLCLYVLWLHICSKRVGTKVGWHSREAKKVSRENCFFLTILFGMKDWWRRSVGRSSLLKHTVWLF